MRRGTQLLRPRNRGYLSPPIGVPRVELTPLSAAPPFAAPPRAAPPRRAPPKAAPPESPTAPRRSWVALSGGEAICWPPAAAPDWTSAPDWAAAPLVAAPDWAAAPLAAAPDWAAAPPFILDGFVDLTVPQFALDVLAELTPPWPMLQTR